MPVPRQAAPATEGPASWPGSFRHGSKEAQRAERVKAMVRYATSFYLFCKECLGYRDMLGQADEVLPGYSHEALCDFLSKDVLIEADYRFPKLDLMPRYTFKSCIATVGYSLWRLVLDDSIRILIYSDTASKAESFLTGIKNHILGSEGGFFRELYGAWEVDPRKGVWNASQIVIRPRKKAHKEPTIDTGGIETTKVGMHYDIILFDDIVSDKNVTTREQMLKVQECYGKARSLLRPGGEIILTGTRWHFGDLYGRIIAEVESGGSFFKVFHRKAEVGGVLPWAKIGLTAQFLQDQRQQQGSYTFSCLYQNEPVDDETAIFKAADFRFYQPGKYPEDLYITCCVDPAISQRSGADDTAITVVGTDEARNMYLLDVSAGKMQPDEMVDELFSLHAKWGFRHVGIETQAFQRMLKRDIELRVDRERSRNRNFRMFQLTEFTGTAQRNKDYRIRGLQPYHERGGILLPGERLETVSGWAQDLVYQMLQYPNAPHDDIVDSLAYHVEIHRPATLTRPSQNIPEYSPAWIERQEWQAERDAEAYLPRWRRHTLYPLSLS